MTTPAQPAMEGGGERSDPFVPEYLWVICEGEPMEILTGGLRLVCVKEGWALAGPEGDIMLNDCHPDEASALRAVGAGKGEAS